MIWSISLRARSLFGSIVCTCSSVRRADASSPFCNWSTASSTSFCAWARAAAGLSSGTGAATGFGGSGSGATTGAGTGAGAGAGAGAGGGVAHPATTRHRDRRDRAGVGRGGEREGDFIVNMG